MIRDLINHELVIYVIAGWIINILLYFMARRQFRREKRVDIYTISAIFSFGLLTIIFTIFLILGI